MDDRAARKKALEDAKARLAKRKREREQLRKLREEKKAGGSGPRSDYGKSALEQTTAMIEKWQRSPAEEKKEDASEAPRVGLNIPGARVTLKEDLDVNTQSIAKRGKEVYSKPCTTLGIDIATELGLITQDTSDETIERMMVEFMKEGVKPWPPKSMAVGSSDAAGAASGGAGAEDDNKDGPIYLDVEEIKRAEEAKLAAEPEELQTLDDENYEKLVSSDAFREQFGQISAWMERALVVNKEHSVFWELDELLGASRAKEMSEDLLVLKESFMFENSAGAGFSRSGDGYAVTCLDFSMIEHTDMFLTGHASPNAANFDLHSTGGSDPMGGGSGLIPEGMLNVWHLMNPKKPEYRLESQSMLSTAVFHPTNPRMVLGATVGGQILAWDLRSKKTTPQFRSRTGHYAPVFSMQFIGHAGASASQRLNFVTMSNVGQVCLWKDDFLVSPQENLQVKKKADSRSQEELPTSAFGIAPRDTKQMIIGCDEGNLYRTDVHSPVNKDTLTLSNCVEDAHFGPITQVEFHPVPAGKEIGRNTEMLFLTSSYDWTVKLWHCSAKEDPKEIGTMKEMQDYIYDVKWSPTNPSVFACGDGSGKITLFDLNEDFETPKGVIHLPTSGGALSEVAALTKLAWSPDGKQLAAGDFKGNVHIFNVHPSLYEASEDDFQQFEEVVSRRLSK